MKHFFRKIRKHRSVIIKVIGVVFCVALIVGFIFFLRAIEEDDGSEIEKGSTKYRIEHNGKWYELRDDIQSVLILGLDKYLEDTDIPEESYLNTQQADFLVLVIIDSTNKKYTLLQINRDTMTPVQQLGLNGQVISNNVEQIALAHTYGNGGKDSCNNVVQAVRNLLYGTEIQNYVAFTMDAIPIINDDAGGVEVEIKDDFSNTDPSLVKGSTVTLKGKQALTFVRARGSMVDDKSNTARMERHVEYINGLISAASAKMNKDSKWAANTVKDVADYMFTDMGTKSLTELLKVIKDYEQNDILKIKGEVVTKEHVEFYPDEDALKEQIIGLMYTPVS